VVKLGNRYGVRFRYKAAQATACAAAKA
jgi:hypothetical protein